MSERQGIEIDYCPKCRGVWLDRGELDKIIERSAGEEAGRPRSDGTLGISEGKHQRGGHGSGHGSDSSSHGRRRKGFLSDLFD
ncbi:MAG: hypothetical protein B7X78_10295 [Sphingomonadales bacterium 39-62-4]|nr:MAG: hypothetical protein B7X78_10295 [Sphingomonadales bacterium 39-62-4]